jgi:HK97 family phage major capsid protein
MDEQVKESLEELKNSIAQMKNDQKAFKESYDVEELKAEFDARMATQSEALQDKYVQLEQSMSEYNQTAVMSEEGFEEKALLGAAMMRDIMFESGKTIRNVNLEDEKSFAGMVMKDLGPRFKKHVEKQFKLSQTSRKLNQKFATVIDTGTSGSIAEWMATEYLKDIKELYRMPLSVEGKLLDVRKVTGHNISIPKKMGTMFEGGAANHWLANGIQGVNEKASPSAASTLTSGADVISLTKAMGYTTGSYEAFEDSYLDAMNLLLRDLVYSLEQAKEYAYINGTTTLTDLYSGGNLVTQSLVNKWNGFMAAAKAGSAGLDISAAELTLGKMRSIYAPMGAAGVDPSRCSFLAEAHGFVKMMNLDEVVTADKFNDNATILKGSLGKVDGRKIYLSEHLHRGNATGVYDTATPSNNVKSTILLIKHQVWDLYMNDSLMVEEDRDPLTQIITKVISQRLWLKNNAVTEVAAGRLYNLG